MRKHHVLVIDDDLSYCEKLRQKGNNFNLGIHYFHNLEDGVEYLKTHQLIKAVILDEKCLLTSEQKPGTEKTNFVFHAMQELKDLEHEQDRFLPFCVNANDIDNFTDDLNGLAQVFQRNKDEKSMLQYIKQQISILPLSFIEREFEDVFEFADDFFEPDDNDIIESILLNMEKTDPENIVSNLALLRRIEEKLFDILCFNILGETLRYIKVRGKAEPKASYKLFIQKIYYHLT